MRNAKNNKKNTGRPTKASNQVVGTIIDAYYDSIDSERDNVVWKVEVAPGDVRELVWPRLEYARCLGIGGVIPTELLFNHLPDMIGKENVTIRYEPLDLIAPDISNKMVENVNKEMEKMTGRKVKYTKKKSGNFMGNV